ncbi:MAG: nucleotide sugar dehydrogenase [Candidatus Omnitrophica bacterium]|nr:nucleotide sugar dehydrogenase [Candidatus Omnitrophota bacterium]MDD5429549.1 nucleotide sugar dehydrogenase [Candidatus Omnitrophota bacterium]
MEFYSQLNKKIRDKKAKICIMGMGYVGLPLALSFADKGYRVYGFDPNCSRIDNLRRGRQYIVDIKPKEVLKHIKNKRFFPTTKEDILRSCDIIIICVPTPLRKVKIPDISYVVKASRTIKKYLRKGQLVILESTTFPTTTREIILPVLRASGIKEEKDFFLCFSPERVNPGDKKFPITKIPKVVGGLSRKSSLLAKALYRKIINNVFVVSSPEVAESAKLLENTFRLVNIALVNEFAIVADKLGINIWEVIEAAKTKPFGFMPFYPGPGVGGHCLSGKEAVLVIDNNENTSVKFFSDFFEETERNKHQQYNFKGIEFLKPKGLKILSFDLNKGKQVFKTVKLLSKRKIDEKVYRITTQGNRRITVTDKHPMIVKEGNKFTCKWARELREKEEIPFVLGSIFTETGPNEIDLIKKLGTSPLLEKIRVKSDDFEWKELSSQLRKLNVGPQDAYDYARGNYLPLKHFIAVEKDSCFRIEHKKLRLCSGRGPSYSEFPALIRLDREFWRFIGYYLSEGCITKDESLRTRITFNSDEKECIKDVFGILDKKNIKYSFYKSKRWKSFHIKVSSNILGYFIRDILSCGTNSYTMKIPDILFSQPVECKMELLKGIFRGDGGVDISIGKRRYSKNGKQYNHQRNTATINYYSISNELFHQVIYLVQSLGIVPSFKKRENLLLINEYKQLRALDGFFLDNKKDKLLRYFDSRVKNMPLKNCTPYKDYFTAKIRKIERVETDYVYSAEVSDTNTFVTSYGMVVHNCIPDDPVYLSWKARELGFKTKMIDLASYMDHYMPKYVVQRVEKSLKKRKVSFKKSRILVLGVTYKRDVKDLRESPAIDVIEILKKKGIKVDYHDPLIPRLKLGKINLKSQPLTGKNLEKYSCVIIVTDHSNIDYKNLVKNAKFIFDTRNVYRKNYNNVERL